MALTDGALFLFPVCLFVVCFSPVLLYFRFVLVLLSSRSGFCDSFAFCRLFSFFLASFVNALAPLFFVVFGFFFFVLFWGAHLALRVLHYR
jgi:hypothetical protein